MERICKVCGRRFSKKTKESYERFKLRKFCSQRCYRKSDSYQKSLYKNGHKGFDLESNPAWKGGRQVDDKGYVRISLGKKKWRYEHRLVMENHLGRLILRGEHIHHLDENKTNNKIENLKLMSASEHIKKYHRRLKKT